MIKMNTEIQLTHFLDAQNKLYLQALSEIKNGKKESHWMWFIFPQLKDLGRSEIAKFYAINSVEEANAYLAHPVLGKHLIEISSALLQIEHKTATEIFGTPDDMKLCSSMTLFANAQNTHPVFEQVLEKYCNGHHDELTVKLLLKDKFDAESI